MSDKATEAGSASLEDQGLPNPEFSQTAPVPSPGDSDAQLEALIEKLSPRLEEIVKSVAQSDKDKGIASAKRDASSALEGIESMRATVSAFKKYVERFGSEDAALQEMDRDNKINKILSGEITQDPVSVGADTRPWGVRQKEILESAGVEPTDRRAVELAQSKKWADPEEYLDALKRATFDWSLSDVTKPKPSSSTVAQVIPSVIAAEGDYKGFSKDALGDRVMLLMKDYTKNADEIKSINKELARRDNIGE